MNAVKTTLGVLLLFWGVIGHAGHLEQKVFQPTTNVSPSGEFSLLVDPSQREGAGPGDYRFEANGNVMWEKRLPFTITDFVVADTGHAAGIAYSNGYHGWPVNRTNFGELALIVLDRDGRLVIEERIKRVFTGNSRVISQPIGGGVFLEPHKNRCVFRVDPLDSAEEWWEFDLRRRAKRGRVFPQRAMGFEWGHLRDARALPGTDLYLLHWDQFVRPVWSDRFTLVDAQAMPVWHLDLDDDYRGADAAQAEQMREQIREQGAILAVGTKGEFELNRVKTKHRVSFRARFQDGAWTVSETERKFNPWPPKASESSAAVIELKRLGEFRMRSPIRFSPDFKSIVVDSLDRIYVADRDSHGVFVFDSHGKSLGVCNPRLADLFNYRRVYNLSVGKRGVNVEFSETSNSQLQFDAKFQPLGRLRTKLNLEGKQYRVQPDGRHAWIVDYQKIQLIRDDKVIREIGRQADRTWLGYLSTPEVASDGSLTVFSSGRGFSTHLNVYASDGTPRFKIPDTGIDAVTCLLKHAVLLTEAETTTAYSLDGGLLGEVRVPVDWSRPLAAKSGGEIWFLDRAKMIVHRFAFP